jgi:hypothetical protein
MAMIAMTTNNSIKVNAALLLPFSGNSLGIPPNPSG